VAKNAAAGPHGVSSMEWYRGSSASFNEPASTVAAGLLRCAAGEKRMPVEEGCHDACTDDQVQQIQILHGPGSL